MSLYQNFICSVIFTELNMETHVFPKLEMQPHCGFIVPMKLPCNSNRLEPYQCNICDFETNFQLVLKNHKCNDSKSGETWTLEEYCCETCNFQTFSLLVFIKHNNTCNQDRKNEENSDFQSQIGNEVIGGSKKIECGYCSYKTRLKQNLKNHVARMHEIVWQQCEHCPQKCKTIKDLRKHVYSRHTRDQDIKWFKCEHCDYKSKWKMYLKTHIAYKHVIEWFQCEKCEFKSKTIDGLKRHLKTSHKRNEEIEWFKCEQCDYKSKWKKYLKTHVAYKPVIVWFHCEQCESKFKTTWKLKQHLKRVHESVHR